MAYIWTDSKPRVSWTDAPVHQSTRMDRLNALCIHHTGGDAAAMLIPLACILFVLAALLILFAFICN